MTFSERLKTARNYAKLTQQQLSDKLGKIDEKPIMSQANISGLETDPNSSGSLLTVQLAVACGVRPEWLATGNGEMVDGLYVEDEKLKRALLLMQDLPDYALDDAIASIAIVKKLTKKA